MVAKVGSHYLQKTTAVGMYPQGASPFGVLDMSGNVWEWCLNEYDEARQYREVGDAGRTVRGGSWYDFLALPPPCRATVSPRSTVAAFRLPGGVCGPCSLALPFWRSALCRSDPLARLRGGAGEGFWGDWG